MNRRDLREELLADLEQIEDNIHLYGVLGRDSAYQTVALQLRNILLGQRQGLLVRVIPQATLHSFTDSDFTEVPTQAPSEEDKARWKKRTGITLFGHANASTRWRRDRGSITLPIDKNAVPLAINEWLQQWIIQPDIKLGPLIHSTASEEVAHTNRERGKLLAKLEGSGIMTLSSEDFEAGRLDKIQVAQEMYQMAIIGIGEYVAQRIRELLAEA